jgi:large repetitive protein
VVHDPNGNFGSRAYTLSTLLPDPTADPEVQGLVAAQAAMARQFTDAQTSNVTRHLEGLHDNFNPCGLNFGLNASTSGALPAYPIDPSAGAGFAPINKDPTPPPPPRPVIPASTCDPTGPVAVWASGALEFGRMTSTGLLVDSTKFSTSGVTAGIDTRLADTLIVGAALGFGLNHTDIGLKGTISDANNLDGIAYASLKPADSVFLDALIGHGSLNFDNTRWVTPDNTTVSGKRDGNTWFGSIGLTSEFRNGAFKFAPYLRLDAMTARLNQYSESGDPTQALTYRAVNISSAAAVVGLRGTVDIKDGEDTYTPNLRLEYKRALDRGFTQSLFYNETGSSQLYAINQGDMTQDIFTGAIGVRARFGSAATLEVEYSLSGTPSGPASWQSQMVRAMAHWSFVAN